MAAIVQLKSADSETLSEVNELLAELSLSPEKRTCSRELLEAIVHSSESELWVAQESRKILGMATLAFVYKPGGIVARVEDIVVLERARGKGLGRLLMEKIIERARTRGASALQLTSRASRESANALYKKLGFKVHETNSFYLNL